MLYFNLTHPDGSLKSQKGHLWDQEMVMATEPRDVRIIPAGTIVSYASQPARSIIPEDIVLTARNAMMIANIFRI